MARMEGTDDQLVALDNNDGRPTAMTEDAAHPEGDETYALRRGILSGTAPSSCWLGGTSSHGPHIMCPHPEPCLSFQPHCWP